MYLFQYECSVHSSEWRQFLPWISICMLFDRIQGHFVAGFCIVELKHSIWLWNQGKSILLAKDGRNNPQQLELLQFLCEIWEPRGQFLLVNPMPTVWRPDLLPIRKQTLEEPCLSIRLQQEDRSSSPQPEERERTQTNTKKVTVAAWGPLNRFW